MITIGAPLFADDKARKYWETKIGLPEVQYHIVSHSNSSDIFGTKGNLRQF